MLPEVPYMFRPKMVKCCESDPYLVMRPSHHTFPFMIGIKCPDCFFQLQEEITDEITMTCNDPTLREAHEFILKKWNKIMRIKKKKLVKKNEG